MSVLIKARKQPRSSLLLHHRCSWPDYPSHQGSAGTETGQRQRDTGLLGHSRDCYGQPDLIHELTASVILEKGGRRRRRKCPVLNFLFTPSDDLAQPETARLTFSHKPDYLLCSSEVSLWASDYLSQWQRGNKSRHAAVKLEFLPVFLQSSSLAEHDIWW